MSSPTEHHTLIVANRTAATPLLLQEVERRAAERRTAFALLIPDVTSRASADWTLESALTLIRRAVRGTAAVEGLVGGPDAFAPVKEAVAADTYDDVIISTLPRRSSEWLRRDLPHRVRRLGVPVTVITPEAPTGNFLAESFTSFGPRQ